MADLEATGTNATVYLRSSSGTDTTDDYRLRRVSGAIDIQRYTGSAWALRARVQSDRFEVADLLEIEGAVPQLRLNETGGGTTYNLKADGSIFYIEDNAGPTEVMRIEGGNVYAANGIAAGFTPSTANLLRWTVHSGTIPASGTSTTQNLATTNKVIGMLGALYDSQTGDYSVYDYKAAAASPADWALLFTRGSPDTYTIQYGSRYQSQNYRLIVFYEP